MMKNKEGFTLIESLFVLSIFLIIASVTALLLKPHFFYLEKIMFFSQLKSDLLYAQNYAITHQTDVAIQIIPEENRYFAKEKLAADPIFSREYSGIIEIKPGTMPLYFQYGPGGITNKFGSFYIKADREQYKLTFFIGRGRFNVEKE
ncbi:type II secretion system GspH family protein [Cytobacillus firmus]|uniref:Competence type IV pilus minor pilin ComGD n=1 Tax=Cytobacillus firmus TaxID=1399 RepID=A0AA46SDL7_CYTFI|nr:competence type IV pilus minor pilin ComGD [Cytobacillus firmus]USK37898.1 type II secretion system GspH family protein [Cytobacillus firmus]UYG94583.1 competence type IV pilus minor pilin ComGD [Cytobacillus firmus]